MRMGQKMHYLCRTDLVWKLQTRHCVVRMGFVVDSLTATVPCRRQARPACILSQLWLGWTQIYRHVTKTHLEITEHGLKGWGSVPGVSVLYSDRFGSPNTFRTVNNILGLPCWQNHDRIFTLIAHIYLVVIFKYMILFSPLSLYSWIKPMNLIFDRWLKLSLEPPFKNLSHNVCERRHVECRNVMVNVASCCSTTFGIPSRPYLASSFSLFLVWVSSCKTHIHCIEQEHSADSNLRSVSGCSLLWTEFHENLLSICTKRPGCNL